jgi:hypothetical protein
MGKLFYLRGRQLTLAFILIFHDGRYNRIAISVGPSDSEKFLRKWGRAFTEGIWEAIQEIPWIDECTLEHEIIEAYDPTSDEIIVPGSDPKEMAGRYLSVMAPLLSKRMS